MSKDIKNNVKKPILLCILDGFGIGDDKNPSNAIAQADMVNYKQILATYPHSQLGTSGLDVGLPQGQIGNSEVGHSCIGAGRVIFQSFPKINQAIQSDELEKKRNLQNLIASCKKKKSSCHLIGMLSDGGVHSHQDHIIYLAKAVAKEGVAVKIHAFLDGRDVSQKSAIGFIEYFQNQTSSLPNIQIATIGGRYYGMDRDKNWERIKLSYDSIVLGEGKRMSDPISYVESSYEQGITDEFVIPAAEQNYNGIEEGDALLVANFRADRIRQISSTLIDPDFKKFKTKKVGFCSQVAMTQYSDHLAELFTVLFGQEEIKNSLGEILQDNNLQQLRIAETEKYAHVTFFFSGGQEDKFKGEERIMVPSPDVATYDLKPQMSANEVGKQLAQAIKSNKYDFIVVNYANPDMVGHSGNMEAAVQACKAIDKQISMLRDKILAVDGIMLITADHGNIENMVDGENNPHTAHTVNPVPLVLIGNDVANIELKNGKLSDIAPTILKLMNIHQPCEMTGEILIK